LDFVTEKRRKKSATGLAQFKTRCIFVLSEALNETQFDIKLAILHHSGVFLRSFHLVFWGYTGCC
jgi:hypothetical protein